jgi:LysM repeat protein
MLGENGSLLLIVNPVAQQGSFYVKLGERFAPVSGFHEVLVDERAEPVIPWTGEVQGVQEWLGASYTTYTYSTENIEHYDIPEGAPRRASRFATAKPAEAAPEVGVAPSGDGSDQAASAAGIEAGPSDEPASTMKWDADEPATLEAYRRAGPVTAPLPALESNAPVEARPVGRVVGAGERQAGGRRLGLPGTGIALGAGLAAIVIIALIWGLLGSNGRKAESNAQLAAGTATPMLVEGAAQTATARSALVTALPSATAIVPTQTPRVSATTTAPPTATPKVDTPTPTASPTSTATVTATPTAAATTYVVQPGDTLTYIARSYGTTVEAIMEANGLSTTALTVGQVLIIP